MHRRSSCSGATIGSATGARRSSAALRPGSRTSADFILGRPAANSRVETLSADHLSVYELTIENRTAFGKRVRDGRLVPLDEDVLTELYTQTHDQLTGAGFEHYESARTHGRAGARSTTPVLAGRAVPRARRRRGVPRGSRRRLGRAGDHPRRAQGLPRGAGRPRRAHHDDRSEMASTRLARVRTSDGVTEGRSRAGTGNC